MRSSLKNRRRTNLGLTRLEDRQNPALHVSNVLGNLMITGTPEASPDKPDVGWPEQFSVERVGQDRFQVMDGTANLGTFSKVKDITIRLDSYDNNIVVDLGGGALKGNLTVDLGSGDRDPASYHPVVVGGAGGQIGGSLLLTGTSSTEQLYVGYDMYEYIFEYEDGGEQFEFYDEYPVASPLTVKHDVKAVGHSVDNLLQDFFFLGNSTAVGRDVLTQSLSFTIVSGEVKRDVTANASGSPAGMYVGIEGTVGRDLNAQGGATAPGYYSVAAISGEIGRDANIQILSGNSLIVFAPGTINEGSVGRDLNIDTSRTENAFTTISIESDIGRHLKIHDGDGTLYVQLGGAQPFTVGGNVIILAGNGNNTLFLPAVAGTSICGALIYKGGSGSDSITIESQSSIKLLAYLGDGDNFVTFAPTAKLGCAIITYRSVGGTTTIIPPAVINFPFFVFEW